MMACILFVVLLLLAYKIGHSVGYRHRSQECGRQLGASFEENRRLKQEIRDGYLRSPRK